MARSEQTGAATSPKPKKKRWYHNIADGYRITKRTYPKLPWIMLAWFLGTWVVFTLLGKFIFNYIFMGIFGFTAGILAATIVLSVLLRRASYTQIEGMPGATAAVLDSVKRGWNVSKEPVAMRPGGQEMVFRAIGRAGIVLISEGSRERVKKMLDDERKKANRVAPNVPVHVLEVGRDEGQVPLASLMKEMNRLKGKLSPAQVAAIAQRLDTLKMKRPPIPKGIDPVNFRPSRKNMR